MIKPISITGGLPTNAPPLLFVIFVSMVKDFFEDRVRQKSDAEENDNIAHVLQPDLKWSDIRWRDVKVGDIVKVNENESFSADIVILQTASDNLCYVETKNIDGEVNLKNKAAPLEIISMPLSEYRDLRIECEPASDKIYSFQGVLTTGGLLAGVPLMYEHIALRGCNLRNTEFVIGSVCYVGPDTRIMRNSVIGTPKKSDLELRTNLQIVLVFLMMLCCCALAATYVLVWDRIYEDSANVYL